MDFNNYNFFSDNLHFLDSFKLGNFFGDILGFITALGLAIGAVTIRSAKIKKFGIAAVVGKLFVAIFALLLKALLF